MTSTNDANANLNVSIKKSTFKTVAVISAAVILGVLSAWYIHASGFLPFSAGTSDIFGFICRWALIIIASVALTVAPSAVLFRFAAVKRGRFMIVSGVVSLLIAAYLGYGLMYCMSDSSFWIFGDITDLNAVIALDVLYHFIFAAVVFCISLLLFKPIKRLAK